MLDIDTIREGFEDDFDPSVDGQPFISNICDICHEQFDDTHDRTGMLCSDCFIRAQEEE